MNTGCLLPNTEILTSEGLILAESLECGRTLRHKMAYAIVQSKRVLASRERDIVTITFEVDHQGGSMTGSITLTSSHPLPVRRSLHSVPMCAVDVRAGDFLMTSNAEAKVRLVEKSVKDTAVVEISFAEEDQVAGYRFWSRTISTLPLTFQRANRLKYRKNMQDYQYTDKNHEIENSKISFVSTPILAARAASSAFSRSYTIRKILEFA